MSVNVKCTIVVSNEKYEAGTEHQEIFTTIQNTSMTGVFSGLPGAFVRSLIEGATRMANDEALRKLKAIKGDILFDDERPPTQLKKKGIKK